MPCVATTHTLINGEFCGWKKVSIVFKGVFIVSSTLPRGEPLNLWGACTRGKNKKSHHRKLLLRQRLKNLCLVVKKNQRLFCSFVKTALKNISAKKVLNKIVPGKFHTKKIVVQLLIAFEDLPLFRTFLLKQYRLLRWLFLRQSGFCKSTAISSCRNLKPCVCVCNICIILTKSRQKIRALFSHSRIHKSINRHHGGKRVK